MTPSIEILDQLITHEGTDQATVDNRNTICINHSKKRTLETHTRKLYMHNLFHIPKETYNLMPISCLKDAKNISIVFDAHGYTIKDNKTSKIIIKGLYHDGLYKIYINNKEV